MPANVATPTTTTAVTATATAATANATATTIQFGQFCISLPLCGQCDITGGLVYRLL
jgi:hypothetical protein